MVFLIICSPAPWFGQSLLVPANQAKQDCAVDMKKLFELPATGISEMNKIIIIRNKDMEFGLLADFILGMKKVNVNSLQRQLPTLTGVRAKYLLGISPEKVIILDGAKLLTDKDLVVNVRNEN